MKRNWFSTRYQSFFEKFRIITERKQLKKKKDNRYRNKKQKNYSKINRKAKKNEKITQEMNRKLKQR